MESSPEPEPKTPTRAPTPAPAPKPHVENVRSSAEPVFNAALLALLVLATLAKLYMLAHTIGTNDTYSLFRFGMTALGPHVSMFDSYRINGPEQNHPQGGLLLFMLCLRLWQHVGHPVDAWFWLRLPALAGDLLGTWAIAELLRSRFPVRLARAMVGCLIVSPLVASAGLYHGNTDMLCVGVALVAALALERDRPALAGALVVVAASVKVPAIVAAAPLGLVALRDGKAVRFSVAAVLTTIVLFGPAFYLGGQPYFRDVFGYLGTITEQPWPPATFLEWLGPGAVDFYQHKSKLFVLPAATLVSISFWRRGRAGDALACVFGVVLLLVPCFGAQYLPWFAAPVALLGLRPLLAYHIAGGVQALIIYANWGGLREPYFAYTQTGAPPLSPWPAFMTWGIVLATLVVALARPKLLGATDEAIKATI